MLGPDEIELVDDMNSVTSVDTGGKAVCLSDGACITFCELRLCEDSQERGLQRFSRSWGATRTPRLSIVADARAVRLGECVGCPQQTLQQGYVKHKS